LLDVERSAELRSGDGRDRGLCRVGRLSDRTVRPTAMSSGGTPRTLRTVAWRAAWLSSESALAIRVTKSRATRERRAIQRLQMARRQPRASRRQPATTCAPTALTTSARRPGGSAARPLVRCSLRSDTSSEKGSTRGNGGRPRGGTERPEERAAANPTEPQEVTRRDRPDAGRGITSA
jgi:hypothetical protein